MSEMLPTPDFNWFKVQWGRDHDLPAENCSYCRALISEEEMPLILSGDDQHARFCAACQQQYWGLG
jgi:hypothetical protein